MANIGTNQAGWGEAQFWREPPELPPGLSLIRQHSFWAGARPGPRGQDLFEDVVLRSPSAEAHLLVAYKSPLSARDVPLLKRRLRAVLEERQRDAEDRTARLPVLVTDSAAPSVRDACRREWVGLLDQTGTVLLHEGPVYVHVEGKQKVRRRARASLYRGRGARVLRCLLEAGEQPLHAKEVASRTHTSFAYAYAVLTRLEEEGFVGRRSPRTGFSLVRPGELVKAWLDSGYRAAVDVEPFYAPATGPRELEALARRLKESGARFAFTLASALGEGDVFVGGTPHGLYLGGDLRTVVDTLKLRKVTPHNFLVLRPEPEAATPDYGVFRPGQRNVSPPQLILDFVAHGGSRGREQAEALLKRWARAHPVRSGGE